MPRNARGVLRRGHLWALIVMVGVSPFESGLGLCPGQQRGQEARGKWSSIPPHKARPDFLYQLCRETAIRVSTSDRKPRRGNMRFLPPLEMRLSSIAPNPVESREAPPNSTVHGCHPTGDSDESGQGLEVEGTWTLLERMNWASSSLVFPSLVPSSGEG